MTSIPGGPGLSRHSAHAAEPGADAAFQPFALQVLSLLLYGGFAIVATILAFVHFWPAGIVLALFLAWRGFGPAGQSRPAADPDRTMSCLVPPSGAGRKTGNASFDAYRAEMLDRLEEEQRGFESFLARLRAAKDEREFDQFMDDRARRGPSNDEPV